jgi:protein-S-isoprenylcysteine O-methyltransferase Ste14
MKKNRIIFYLIFALFHVGAFIFTVALDNNSSLLFSMVSWVPTFKWITFLGLVLVCVDFAWFWLTIKEMNREKAALTHEVNTLKAKLFDMQESSAKNTGGAKPLNPPSQGRV